MTYNGVHGGRDRTCVLRAVALWIVHAIARCRLHSREIKTRVERVPDRNVRRSTAELRHAHIHPLILVCDQIREDPSSDAVRWTSVSKDKGRCRKDTCPVSCHRHEE